MKLNIFDRGKFVESINKLEKRKAPTYVIEAYKNGLTSVVNSYYKLKLQGIKESASTIDEVTLRDINEVVAELDINYLTEALKKKDIEFLKAFFQMTNMDILSGDKLPPDASLLIKQGVTKRMNLSSLANKLR